ncbi:MAG: hypothetical protein PHE53_09165 [Thermoguttaceae bacterium]|nr:hypothetical protein [Thermoguttaceae bacterium]
MKSERRHELEQNALATWALGAAEKAQSHSREITTGVLVVVALIAVFLGWRYYSALNNESAWNSYFAAAQSNDAEALANVAKAEAAHPAGWLAAMESGKAYLANGCDQFMRDRAAAVQDLRTAEEQFSNVLKRANDATIRCDALRGRATVYEMFAGTTENDKSLEKALADVKKIQDIARRSKLDEYLSWADGEVTRLENHATAEFYSQLLQNLDKPKGLPAETATDAAAESTVPTAETLLDTKGIMNMGHRSQRKQRQLPHRR